MSNFVFIHTYNCGRGKGANVTVSPFEDILDNPKHYNRTTQIADIGEGSCSMCWMGVEKFEATFNPEQIELMRDAGALDYYPKGTRVSVSNEYIYKGTEDKYPIFAAPVYKKYGVARDAQYKINNI